MARRGDARFNPQVYQDYSYLQLLVVNTLVDMISRTKGSMLTFNAKKIAVNAGLPTHPVLLTLVKDILEQLHAHGLIQRMAKSSHGLKYSVTKESKLWELSKGWATDSSSVKDLLVIMNSAGR